MHYPKNNSYFLYDLLSNLETFSGVVHLKCTGIIMVKNVHLLFLGIFLVTVSCQ